MYNLFYSQFKSLFFGNSQASEASQKAAPVVLAADTDEDDWHEKVPKDFLKCSYMKWRWTKGNQVLLSTSWINWTDVDLEWNSW